jgi:hypothetical protein
MSAHNFDLPSTKKAPVEVTGAFYFKGNARTGSVHTPVTDF